MISAQKFLPTIDIRGIDEVDTAIHRHVYDPARFFLGRFDTEVHGAETKATHAKSGPAKLYMLHRGLRH